MSANCSELKNKHMVSCIRHPILAHSPPKCCISQLLIAVLAGNSYLRRICDHGPANEPVIPRRAGQSRAGACIAMEPKQKSIRLLRHAVRVDIRSRGAVTCPGSYKYKHTGSWGGIILIRKRKRNKNSFSLNNSLSLIRNKLSALPIHWGQSLALNTRHKSTVEFPHIQPTAHLIGYQLISSGYRLTSPAAAFPRQILVANLLHAGATVSRHHNLAKSHQSICIPTIR